MKFEEFGKFYKMYLKSTKGFILEVLKSMRFPLAIFGLFIFVASPLCWILWEFTGKSVMIGLLLFVFVTLPTGIYILGHLLQKEDRG